MKAILRERYGGLDELRLAEVPRPDVGDDGVLVRVRAASVNAGDSHVMRGSPWVVRLMLGGLWRPKTPALGSDLAGRVEDVGGRVTGVQPGDEVFGTLAEAGFGAFAEYAVAPASALVPKPSNASFGAAAAVPTAGTAALQGLRDRGRIQAGQTVLVNGASGGVGTFAIQIARAFGAHVTGVCSTRNMALVESLGADRVIDYTREDVTRIGRRWDLILDAAAHRSIFDYRRALKPGGAYVLVGGAPARTYQLMALGPLLSTAGSRRMELLLSRPNRDDLLVLKELMEGGEISPVVDRTYGLDEVADAIRHREEGHPQGKIVIRV